VEERKSWLPAGLEGSGWEPDDRASQRSEAKAKRSSPSASAGTWEPYDPDRPESKRARKGGEEAQPHEEKPAEAPKGESEQAREDARADQEGAGRKDDTGSDPEDGPESGSRDEPKSDREPKSEQDSGSGEGGRSDVDAMGQDKHRQVVGQRYGASRAKQLIYYGTFVAFVIAAYLGLKVAVDHLDKAPAHDKDQAPWAKPGAPDEPLGGFTPKDKGAKGPTNFQ
jgi:hypothetical protein